VGKYNKASVVVIKTIDRSMRGSVVLGVVLVI